MTSGPNQTWLAGATGFLGSHVLRQLKDEGQDCVATSGRGGEVDGTVVDAVDCLESDAVARSAEGCETALLCMGRVSRGAEAARGLHRLHVEGVRACLAGLKRAGVRRVVLASTSGTIAVGTDPSTIHDESSPPPMQHISSWPYYRTKYFSETEALERNAQEFEVIVVNPSLLLGPGDLRESSTGDVRRFLDKSILAVPAGGLAFVDVRDAARGMILARDRGRPGERYLLNAANMTLRAFFARLSRVSGVKAPWMSLPKNRDVARGLFGMYERGLKAIGGVPPVDAASVEMGQYFWYCSADKAERELGFSARDPGETLRDTVADLVERRVVAPPELRSMLRHSD